MIEEGSLLILEDVCRQIHGYQLPCKAFAPERVMDRKISAALHQDKAGEAARLHRERGLDIVPARGMIRILVAATGIAFPSLLAVGSVCS